MFTKHLLQRRKDMNASVSRWLIAMCLPAMTVYLCFIFLVCPAHVDVTINLIACCLIAIVVQVTIIQCLTYLVTPISWRMDWDPDNVVIPVLMSLSDCTGNAILLTAFLFLKYMDDPNSIGQPSFDWGKTGCHSKRAGQLDKQRKATVQHHLPIGKLAGKYRQNSLLSIDCCVYWQNNRELVHKYKPALSQTAVATSAHNNWPKKNEKLLLDTNIRIASINHYQRLWDCVRGEERLMQHLFELAAAICIQVGR